MSNASEFLERTENNEHRLIELVDHLDGAPGRALSVVRRDPEPEVLRRRRRAHTIQSCESLVEYAKRHLKSNPEDNPILFVDPLLHRASLILDEDRQHLDEEQVDCIWSHHDHWQAWAEAIMCESLTAADLTNLIRDTLDVVQDPNPRELLMLLAQMSISEETQIDRGRGPESTNGVTVKTTVRGVRGEERVQFPESVILKCPLFAGDEDSDGAGIRVDLWLDASKDKGVRFSLTSSDADVQVARRFMDDVAELRERMAELKIPVILGEPKHVEWRTY